jgi:hypothetical protein
MSHIRVHAFEIYFCIVNVKRDTRILNDFWIRSVICVVVAAICFIYNI